MATRVTSSTFVGRSGELAELEAALAEAAEGHPSLAFVAGDSGVGKTRLVDELAGRARARGARVLSGDCVALGEGELPYAPLVAALRALARADEPVLHELPSAIRDELVTLLPKLAPAQRPVTPSGDAAAQGRLFEALLWLLDRLGEDAPVLLAIEDLHWADRATRSFVAFLGRNVCSERLLVVATYRADELHRRHPLRPLLAELERDVRAKRIDLPPFTREELALQLGDVLGLAPSDDLVDRVLARSEGHPLFVEELLAADLDARGALPSSLREALMVRIERLSPAGQEILQILAVSQRLDDDLLVAVTGQEPVALRTGLRDALSNHIVSLDREGRYRFRHALLREVVHDDLLPGERAAIDLQLARALEARAEREGLAVYLAAGIAHHYASAGDQPAALRASVRAASAAESVHAYGPAAELLERAVELFDRVPDAETLAGADKAGLLIRAAHDHRLDGDVVRQELAANAALRLVDERLDPRRVARILETIADAEWHLGRGDAAVATTDRAIALLPIDEASAERGLLMSRRAKSLMLRGRHTESIAAARAALPVVEAVGDLASHSNALNALGTSLICLGHIDEGSAKLREALALAEQDGSAWHTTSAYLNLADSLNGAGRLREARAVADDGQAHELRKQEEWLPILRAELAIEAGEWDEAERILAGIRRRLVGTAFMNLNVRRADLALGRADHASARARLDEVAGIGSVVDEPQWSGPLGALRAELERREGNLDAARAAVRRALGNIEGRSEDAGRLARLSATGATVEADAAQLARDLGDADAERAALAEIEGHVARARDAAEHGGPLARAWLLMAAAERTRAAADGADSEAFAAAAEAWDALERPAPAATMRMRMAEALVRAGDREAASNAATVARRAAERMGAEWVRAEVEGLAARARLGLADPAAPRVAHPEQATEDPFGLTTRERQVLELVARGATNREIGAELFMAEKTASVHVSRILAKLDVRTRTEAAGVAHRLRLVS